MKPVFGNTYSNAYNLLYKQKNYNAECDLIEKIIQGTSKIPVHSVLDLGCGTGNHALRLAERGYEITGVDRSNAMLDVARKNAHRKKIQGNFVCSDIREFNDGRKYDSVIMMFAVLGYQVENEDVIATLKTVSRHLKKGGVFICDVWYGPAVLSQKPGDTVRVIRKRNGEIIRTSRGILDTFRHLVTVHFHLWNIQHNKVLEKTEEEHVMRFFYPQELALFFNIAGLKLHAINSFLDGKTASVTDVSWNILVTGMVSD